MKPLHTLTDDELAALARRAATLPDAPPAWQQAARALWPLQPTPAAQPGGTLLAGIADVVRRAVAALSFDSAAGPALAHGMRAAASPMRQLLFTALGRDIDLRVAPADPGFLLQGQVLGPDAAGWVTLGALAGEGVATPPMQAAIDPLGEFRLAGVAPGDYRMTLTLGTDEIELPTLTVGHAG